MNKLIMTLGKQHSEHFHDEKAYEKFLHNIFPPGHVQEPCKLIELPKSFGNTE